MVSKSRKTSRSEKEPKKKVTRGDDGLIISRYKGYCRKLFTSTKRSKWRTPSGKVRYNLSPLQKSLLREGRQNRKKDLNAALSKIHSTNWEHAKELRAQFGGHDEKYYHRMILQGARLNVAKRRVNRYNAFARAEAIRINAGMSYIYFMVRDIDLTVPQTPPRAKKKRLLPYQRRSRKDGTPCQLTSRRKRQTHSFPT